MKNNTIKWHSHWILVKIKLENLKSKWYNNKTVFITDILYKGEMKMIVQDFKPERDFKVNDNVTMDDLKRICESNETITVEPKRYNLKDACIRVHLGNNIFGSLPFNEVSLDGLNDEEIVPVQVKAVMRKKNIRCKITSIKGTEILLSRKSNLEEVFNKVSKIERGVFNAMVENVGKYNVFFDIAEGVCAYCDVSQLSRVYLNDARDWISNGMHIRVKVTKTSESDHLIWCSAKKAAFGDYSKIKPGTKVVAKVGNEIRDNDGTITGYFVEITPAISGIADIRVDVSETFVYPKLGDKIRCYVRNVKPKERRIKLYID